MDPQSPSKKRHVNSPKTSRSAAAFPRSVAGVPMPRRRFTHTAANIARTALPAPVVRHAFRVFVFAALEAHRLRMAVMEDLLFVSAHFANMGLSASYADSLQRYELDGADAAKSFLENEGVRQAHGIAVWDAICLHTTPCVTERMGGLTQLLSYGVKLDLFGDGIEHLPEAILDEILAVFPRGENFANEYLEAIGKGVVHRPESTFGTFSADVLERYSATFYRSNFCGRVLGSLWDSP